MAISYEWAIPNRVLHIVIDGTVERGTLANHNEQLLALVQSGEKPVHVLADATKLDKINTPPREAISGSNYLRDDNVGYVVVIGTTGVIDFFVTLIKAVIPMQLLKANTVDEALKQLRANDHTLP